MAGGPTSEVFADIRDEGERLVAALADVTSAATAAAKALGPAGGTPGASAAGGKAGRQAKETSDFEVFEKSAKSTIKSINELAKATKAIGGSSLAKSLGLGDASKQIDAVASSLNRAKDIAEGLGASAKLIASAWKPVAAGVLLVLGPLVAVQQITKALTGDNLTLAGTVRKLGLEFVRSAQQARILAQDLKGALGGTVDYKALEDAQAEIGALNAQIQEIKAQDVAPDVDASRGKLAELGGLVAQFGTEVGSIFKSALGNSFDAELVERLVSPESMERGKIQVQQLQVEIAKLGGKPLVEAAAQLAALQAELGPLARQAAELRASGRSDAGARLVLLDQEIAARQQLAQLQIEEQEKARERKTPLGQFKVELQETADLTKQTYDLIGQGVAALSSTISSALIDGFTDPQADIRESFANLFKQISKLILDTIIQATIARAILSFLGPAPTGAAGGGLVVSAAAGGLMLPRGYARGGPVVEGPRMAPLPGLDARDTIPARLMPNEYVVTAHGTATTGVENLDLINAGRVPGRMLSAALAMMGIRPRGAGPRISYSDGIRGMAGGGSVGAASSSRGGRSGAGGGAVPVMVVGESEAEAFFDNMGQALVRHMQRKPGPYKKAMGL